MSYHFPTESTAHTSSSPPIEVQKVHVSDIIETQEKPSTDITSSTSLQKNETDQQQVSSSLVAVSCICTVKILNSNNNMKLNCF